MADISRTKKGMILDISPKDLNGEVYSYALNASIESNSEEGNLTKLQNDGSNILAVNFPVGYGVIGKRKILEQNRTIVALVNPTTGASEIGEILNCNYDDDRDDTRAFSHCAHCEYEEQKEKTPLEETTQTPYCSYRTIISAACLNFDINYPVKIRYKITDCGLNIYFTDKLNQRRLLYFDYEDNNPNGNLVIQDRFKVVTGYEEGCEEPIYSNELDCNKINYHPDFTIPCIDSVETISGGGLLAGVYQFIIAYGDSDDNVLTNYFYATNPIPIFTKEITFETNYKTSKAISLQLTNIENTNLYGYYHLIVAETIDNFTTFKKVGIFPTTQKNIVYTGNDDNLPIISATELFQRKVYYNTAGAITDANDMLFFGDLEEFDKPNLQRVANNIELLWKTIAVPENIYREPKNTFNFRGYQRDEVYPFAIVFIRKTGEELGPFHIPGPSKAKFLSDYAVNVDAVVANNDVLEDTSCNSITRNKTWQVYNTGVIIGTPHEDSPTCDTNKTWEYGDFAYWESIRKYPNNSEVWGDLCGENIRFHKFPDSLVTHIHNGLSDTKTFFDSNIIYPIGIRVNHQSVIDALADAVTANLITQEDVDSLSSYYIVRGNRVGNKSIVAKGLLFDMWSYDKNDNTYYYPNYAYNDLRDDDFISNDETTYQGGNNSDPIPNVFTPTKRYTFHSPDTHFTNPTIGTEIKLETEEYGTSEGFFNLAEEESKQKLLSTFSRTLTFAVGVAAAFSGEKEKRQRVVTSKSERHLIPIITGTNPGATVTVPVPTPFTVQGDLILAQPPNPIFNLSSGGYEELTGLALTPYPFASEVSDTSYKGTTFQLLNPASLNPAGIFLQQLVYMGVVGLKEMQIIADVLKTLAPNKNLSIQYNSVGRYNNYEEVSNSGNKIRAIERSAYLEPIIQLINESISATAGTFSNIYVNNWNRERSIYLKTDTAKAAFPSPSVTDTSRFTMDSVSFEQEDLEKRKYETISSYYASIKNFLPDQYGDVTDIKYIGLGHCPLILNEEYTSSEDGLFGGDTFVTRFALKRKMPFFLQTRFNVLNNADVRYSELGNVGYPNYYFNTEEPLLERIGGNTWGGDPFDFLTDLLGVASSRMDAKKQKLFYQSGFIHLYNYGIPYFLVESDVNTDFRHGENNKEKDFYPHQSDLGYWFQQKNVPISEDNYYFYNTTYSKQNKEQYIGPQIIDVVDFCTVKYPSRVVNSEQGINSKGLDNWLVFKANNYYDAPRSYGRIIGIDNIENDSVLVRFENNSQIFNAYDVLEVGESTVQVGSGKLFQTSPKNFSSSDLGYAGSQHSDLLRTEFGHVWPDAKRGQVFNLLPGAKSLEELTKDGMKNWFKENLPFQILKDFPEIELKDIDNNFKGIGISLAFDKRFNRFFITKLDWKKIHSGVTYNKELKQFEVDDQAISISDTRYFCSKCFTISYNLASKTWVSFHSFTPNFYIDDIDYIQSGVNNFDPSGNTGILAGSGETAIYDASGTTSLWSHNVTNKSYQVYYGKLYPFVIETLSDPNNINDILNSVEYDCDVVRYHSLYDYSSNRTVTFNKAIVYNDKQCSGLLELIVRNENNLYNNLLYPKIVNNKIQILITNKDNTWRFNQFHDTISSQTANLPFFKNKCNNADKDLNLKAFNYYKPDIDKQVIRGRFTKIRLINDSKSNYNFIFNFLQHAKTKSSS